MSALPPGPFAVPVWLALWVDQAGRVSVAVQGSAADTAQNDGMTRICAVKIDGERWGFAPPIEGSAA
jgi:hypothetical protein